MRTVLTILKAPCGRDEHVPGSNTHKCSYIGFPRRVRAVAAACTM